MTPPNGQDWAVVRAYNNTGDAQIMLELLRKAEVPVKLLPDSASLADAVGGFGGFLIRISNIFSQQHGVPVGGISVPKAALQEARAILATRKDVGLDP